MLGHRSALANLVAYLSVFGFVLLTAVLAGAQTPSASIGKVALEESALIVESDSKGAKPSTLSSSEAATEATAESFKSN